MGRATAAVIVAALMIAGCGGEQASVHKAQSKPTPSAAVLGQFVSLPPYEPGVVNFKLTLQRIDPADGFELRFDVPHADTNMFQFCDPKDNPCVANKTYGFQFRHVGPGKVPYAFRRQIRFGTPGMQIESFQSGTVDLSAGGEFVAIWPEGSSNAPSRPVK
jgi:hypothetical protein